jgi:hypothetical protein
MTGWVDGGVFIDRAHNNLILMNKSDLFDRAVKQA